MRKLLTLLAFEYIKDVKKKSFWIATFVLPLLMIGIVWISTEIKTIGKKHIEICFVDYTGIGKFIENKENISFHKCDEPDSSKYKYVLRMDWASDSLIMATVESEETPSPETLSEIKKALRKASEKYTFVNQGVQVDSIIAQVPKVIVNVSSGNKFAYFLVFAIAFVITMITYILLIIYGTAVMNAIVEEKQKRVVELLLSSMPSSILLTGKILAIILVGLTQLAVWILTGVIIIKQFNVLGDLVPTDAGNNLSGMIAMLETVIEMPLPVMVILIVLYVLGGMLLYITLFAGVGALVNDTREASVFTFPVMLPIVGGTIIVLNLLAVNPQATIISILSYVPFTAPVVMPARLPFSPPLWEIALSLVLLYIMVVIAFWIVGKLFRIGLLYTGSRPTLRTILKWLKA